MTGRQLSLLAGAGSALLLIAALGFQAAGYAPCELCILQRWPHVAAAVIAGLIWLTGRTRALAILGLAAAATATALAFYHTGVELAWWAGPSHCSGGVGDLARLTTQDLMTRLQAAPVVRCDEIAWSFLGVSMAGWNAILSAGLAGLWAVAARKGN
ncbi:disulfide bond formation protein B [Paracoccus sp. T5]|uniref:disulfide bond formation protein B n=1 Tax=Paracoccus sp. T5 TaxID=3402161 RepID=UPI003ADE09B8